VKQFALLLFLLTLWAPSALFAQTSLAPDQAGCVDSKYIPKLSECRIDNCEKKDGDHRDVAVGEAKGDALTTAIDGDSRSVMYECRETVTAANVIQHAATQLKTLGFEIPYQYADKEASITGRKDDMWVIVDAASHFYTLTEIKSIAPDFSSVSDAESMWELLQKYGHVPLYGVHFLPARGDMTPESVIVLEEVVTMLNDHPELRLRIEGHTDNVGAKVANQTLGMKRANTVVTWMLAKGVKRARLDPQGIGEAKPVADNGTEEGRAKNRRIEIVKIAATDQ
jgi:outer membrane protein OmpA-like peptidoglycan-associated protein